MSDKDETAPSKPCGGAPLAGVSRRALVGGAAAAAKAVLEKDLPTLLTNSAYEAFKSMSLKELQPMASGALTDELLAKVDKDLAAVPFKPAK